MTSITAIITATHTAHPKPSSINLWTAVVAASVIVGLIAGILGIASPISRYKKRKVDRRIDEIVQSQLDAEGAEKNKKQAEQELEHLKGVRDDLSRQISQLPEEANKLFLKRQLEELARSISKDFTEYESIETRLQPVATTPALDPRIREVIESSILPVQKERERRNSYILLILIALLILNLSPIRLSDYVWRYFNILSNSPDWTPDSPLWMIVFGSAAVAVLLWCASSLVPKVQKYIVWFRWTPLAIISGALLAASIALGYNFRDDAAGGACYPYSCGYPSAAYIAAGIAYNFAPIWGGFLLFLIFRARQKIFSAFTRWRTG